MLSKLLILACIVFCQYNVIAQSVYTSGILVNKEMKDTFSFTGQWAYAWDILKDDNGKFFTAEDKKILPADTAHFFFTANCRTNVQGGYDIRYCYASQNGAEIILNFSDGLPAYAGEFYVHIKNDSFCFKPKTVYPQYIRGQKTSYRIDKEKLVLDKSVHKPGDKITGYAEFEFTEITSVGNKAPQETKLYLKGYFRTPLRKRN